ncbi:MAG TPA: MMPL family transporter, partial [Ktedonobacterales bacterium]
MQLDELPDTRAEQPVRERPAQPSTPTQRNGQPHGLYRLGVGYGRLIYKLRWVVLALWVVGLLAAAPFAAQVASVLTGNGYSFNGSESVKVNSVLADKLHQPKTTLLVVFQSADAQVGDAAYQLEVNDFISAAKAYPHVSSVVAGGVGQDQKTTSVAVNFDTSPASDGQFVNDFKQIVPQGADATPARAYLTGEAPVSAAFNQLSQTDTEQAEMKGLPIALAVLLIVFGSLVAGLLPLLLAAFAVPVA